jgi:hypothetical protein
MFWNVNPKIEKEIFAPERPEKAALSQRPIRVTKQKEIRTLLFSKIRTSLPAACAPARGPIP